MRLRLLVLLGLSTLPHGAHAQAAPAANPEIFRYVTIVGDTIRLGVPWRTASRYAPNATDSAIVLPYGSFGGADGLEVFRDPTGSVTRIMFLYGNQRNFAKMLAEYRAALGAPADSSISPLDGGTQRHSWLWRDRATVFELVRFVPAQGQVQASAILSNRVAGVK